jgi:hypothetical protein
MIRNLVKTVEWLETLSDRSLVLHLDNIELLME